MPNSGIPRLDTLFNAANILLTFASLGQQEHYGERAEELQISDLELGMKHQMQKLQSQLQNIYLKLMYI